MSDVEKIIAEAHEKLQEFVAVALAAHDGVINVPRGGKYWQAADRVVSALRAAGYEVVKRGEPEYGIDWGAGFGIWVFACREDAVGALETGTREGRLLRWDTYQAGAWEEEEL